MQERIYELEKAYKRYLKKLWLKRVLGLFVGIFALWGVFFFWEKWQEKKALSSKINAEKRLLEDKISQAKITQEKQKINHQKLEREKELLREELELLQNPVQKFIISSNALNLANLKRSFYQNPSIEKALKLAELYLENKDYKKSIFWSLKANEMDASSKQSLLLFAKAKEALGEVVEAKRVLELYEAR
ncbi:transformation system protein [Campylobacter upsaliensis]|uniref:CDC27 family protein n=1 Tax=Campylobacter upsaliensis TaxID=28080 RepID=UPI001281BB47|nr:CDC27 family protein [Campylobacter upsaliensis]EAJ0879958.1 transformation system protein [Campylobacter upsaliensis]EAK1781303.1 transformation system protein [Campylobacter upsaliensis]EAK4449364.1 transformation system protein [Campylobacter upsaliensis]EGP8041340.1 transformation system protein [Campylobacter upsaliensis]ELP8580012.1 transformation system protein [Campylobacter upsaliensis]